MNLPYAGILAAGLALGVHAAQLPSLPQFPVQSASGQFSVQVADSRSDPNRLDLTANPNLLPLDGTLLTVSAERLRQHLTREIGDNSPWRDRILFRLHPTQSLDAPAQLTAEWRGDGWRYQVSLPDYMDRDRFVRALVEVDLMEIANRTSAGRLAEVPPWLTEGLTGLLLVSRPIEIILPPPRNTAGGISITPLFVETQTYQPLAPAHAQMQTNAPLTIEQLSWPTPESFNGRSGQVYRHCSQLLVTRLQQLPDGSALLNAFIRNLSRHYNWQVAFLETYQAQFPTLLDFEKWWSLQVTHFTARELGATYPYGDSALRLQQALQLPVEVRLRTSDLPMHGEIRLQTVIEEWDLDQQRRAIDRTLTELSLLRARISPELIPLLDDYRLTLEDYLRARNRSGLYLPRGINRQVKLNAVVRQALATLNQLDAELSSLLPPPPADDTLAETRR